MEHPMVTTYKIYALAALSIIISGCTSSHTQFYKEYPYTATMLQNDSKGLIFLADGEEPKVLSTDNIERDTKIMVSKHYVPIGFSSFNGELEGADSVADQARRIKAVTALYAWKYINTQTNSGTLLLPQTNNFSGTVNTYGTNGSAFSTFNGSSTGTVATPYSITQRRYDQEAVFFLKDTKKGKFGILPSELSREKKIEIGGYGILIDNIFEDSPAYNSELLIGDILIEMDGKKIQDFQDFEKMLREFDTSKGICSWTIIRNGATKIVKIKF